MKHKRLPLILLLLFCLLMFPTTAKNPVRADLSSPVAIHQSSPTYVSGIINTNTTWAATNSPYVVTSNILVDTGATLTIMPGVLVEFSNNYYLMVKGALKAIGESSSKIVFTTSASSPSPRDWQGIKGSNGSEINLRHSTIQYADTGVEARDANITISDNEVFFNNVGISFVNLYEKNAGTLVNNTIKSNDIGISVTIGGSVGGDLKIENNAVIYNRLGVKVTLGGYGVNVTVAHNVISLNAGAGLMAEGTFWPIGVMGPYFVNVTQNYVTFNDLGIISEFIQSGAGPWGKSYIEDNDIHGNTEFNFKISHDYAPTHPSSDQNASGNYWGTSNTTVIDETIYDFYDDYTLGKLYYTPILVFPLESRHPNLVIDRVEPTVSMPSPLNGSHIESTDVVIIWNGQDAGSGIDHYEVRLDESIWINFGTNGSATFNGLSYGNHKAEVKAIDKTSISSIASVDFVLVMPRLSVTVTAAPLIILSNQTSSISIRVTYGGNPISNAIGALSLQPYQGGTLSITTGNTDSNGYLTSTFAAPTVTTQTTITIKAEATKTGYLSGQNQTQITVNPSPPQPQSQQLDPTLLIYAAIIILIVVGSMWALSKRRNRRSQAKKQ